MKRFFVILAVCMTGTLYAQVDEIKQASDDNSSKKSGHSDSGDDGDSGGGFFAFDLFFNAIPDWQRFKLQDARARYPSMVSLEVFMQGAVKPSSYYILWPRIRGNWGLFSTDYRINYLIEEDADGGLKHIRTNDWQVLQLNLITSRFITFRLGTGVMKEAFADGRSFNEWDFMLGFHAPDQFKQIWFEYRFAKDWETGANPRREFSAQYQHQLFSAGALHGYFSAGVVYQRYYNSIEVWGIQGGLILRLY
ncbi:MAG: hypothetical protein HRU69_11270 [Flammeovirgaceae bacterium]|nr:MAG: hypothetical protein HRU69_11270 [Flammeovirgaceae bacterium]